MKIIIDRITNQDGLSIDSINMEGLRDVKDHAKKSGCLLMFYQGGKSGVQFETRYATKKLGRGEYAMSCPKCPEKRFLVSKDPVNGAYWGECPACKRTWAIYSQETGINILSELKPFPKKTP